MFSPSVLPACNQSIISLLPKPPGKMTTWFHQSLSWMLRWNGRILADQALSFPQWIFKTWHSAVLAPSLSSFACVSVSEREMCLHVFSKQIALIHLFPYQSWQRLQLPGAPSSCSGCEWLAATHLQGTSWDCWAGYCLSASADTCRSPPGVPAQESQGCRLGRAQRQSWRWWAPSQKKGFCFGVTRMGNREVHPPSGCAAATSFQGQALRQPLRVSEIMQWLFSWKSRNIWTRAHHLKADTLWSDPKRAQHPCRRHDMLALQLHISAALIHWSEAEDQISIIVLLYSKRIFFKWCNQIPAQKNMYKGNK